MILVNFKTYPEGTGEKAVELAKICEEVSQSSDVEIIPVVQVADLFRITQAVKIPVWVQHLDWYPQGQYTGWTNLEAVVESEASGSLLNHAEHQVPPGTIKQVIRRIRNLDHQSSIIPAKRDPAPRDNHQSFRMMVCTRTLGQAERLAKLKPNFLAYEPPELIGGDLAVSEAEPNVIKRIVKRIPDIPIIVGAGVKSGKDVEKSIQLGAVGVLVSSGVVLAKDQKEALLDLAKGFKK